MKSNPIKLITAAIIACLSFTALPAFADTTAGGVCGNPSVPPSVQAASGCSESAPDVTVVIQNILNGIIITLGIVAVIYIVIGGVGYMTSTGDSDKLSKAKRTILYATIGLVICALAATIINFTIGIINSGNSNSATEETNNNENTTALVLNSSTDKIPIAFLEKTL